MAKFKKGDVVHFKSGGLGMNVNDTHSELVDLIWQCDNGSPCMCNVHEDVLEIQSENIEGA